MKKNLFGEIKMKKKMMYAAILIFVFFVLLEICSYLYIKNPSLSDSNKAAKKTGDPIQTQRYAPVKVFDISSFEQNMRKIIPGNPSKGTILFYGDSYTWGVGVEEDETLPFYVSEKTGRTVINRAYISGGINNAVNDATDIDFTEKMSQYPPVEYIVYTFINNQVSEILKPIKNLNIYKDKESFYELNYEFVNVNGKYTAKIPSPFKCFLYSFYTAKAFAELNEKYFSKESGEEKLAKVLIYIKTKTDEKFPGSKFVILQYKDGSHILLSEETVKLLTDNGFIVLDAEETAGHELDGEQWRTADKEHPSPSAYNDVATGLVKRLGL